MLRFIIIILFVEAMSADCARTRTRIRRPKELNMTQYRILLANLNQLNDYISKNEEHAKALKKCCQALSTLELNRTLSATNENWKQQLQTYFR